MLYVSDSPQGHVGLNPRDVIGHSIHDLVQSEEDSETIRDNLQPRGERMREREKEKRRREGRTEGGFRTLGLDKFGTENSWVTGGSEN